MTNPMLAELDEVVRQLHEVDGKEGLVLEKMRMLSTAGLFIKANHATLADMAKRMEAAERDSKRLDWLSDPNQCSGQVLLPTASVEANLHDMRAAIDHAMNAAIDATQEGEG